MSRYIEADKAIETLTQMQWHDEDGYSIENYDDKRELAKGWIDCVPTADVIEVVRCKDCTRQLICYHSDDYFCADGERREEIDGCD